MRPSINGLTISNTYDPVLALRVPVPGFQSSRLNINRLGFRGAEISSAKPDGVVRIAFVGGSTIFCAEVSSEHFSDQGATVMAGIVGPGSWGRDRGAGIVATGLRDTGWFTPSGQR